LETLGPLKLWTPELATLDWRVVVLALVSAYLLLQRHWKIPPVLLVASALALGIRFVAL
jgi:chromate transporter